MANSEGPVQSVDRVLDIIETLSAHPHGMSLSDIARETELHVSTAHRLLQSLTMRGYVQKDEEAGKYRLTLRMFELGSRMLGSLNLLSVARPFVEQLAEHSGETAHLVARFGDEVVYLYKEDMNSSVVRMASFVGLRNPMYCTGVGKCILAYLPETEIRAIWSRTDIKAYTENTVVDCDRLIAQLSEIRKQGYAVDNEEHESGVLCVAAPIFDYSGGPVGAISISVPAVRADEAKQKEFAAAVVACTEAVSKLMGGTGQKP